MTKYKNWIIEIEKTPMGLFSWTARSYGGGYLADREGGDLGTKSNAIREIKRWIELYETNNQIYLRTLGLTVI